MLGYMLLLDPSMCIIAYNDGVIDRLVLTTPFTHL